MSPRLKNYLLVFLAVAALVCGGFAIQYHDQLAKLRLEQDGLSAAERARWQKQVWDAEKRRNALEAELAALRSRGGPGNADGEDAGARGGPGGENRGNPFANPRVGAFAELRDNPEFVKLMTTEQKAALDLRYAALFKNLHLTPAQIDQFKNLLVEKQSAFMDVMMAARDQGINPRDPDGRKQLGQLVQQAQTQVDSQIQQTLGDEAFNQYKSYEQTLPQRNTVNQLAQSLSYTNAPLQDYQTEQLINILAANSGNGGAGRVNASTFNGIGAINAIIGGGSVRVTDAAITQAQTILSPPQVDALKQMQATQQAQQQMQKMLRDARQGGSGTTTTTSGATAAPPANSGTAAKSP